MVPAFLIPCLLIGTVCEIKAFKSKPSAISKVNISLLKISYIEVLLLIILFTNNYL